MTTEWKRFECLTQKIQKQLTPNAKVRHNEFVIGKSGAKNQLDVTVRALIGQYEYFCVIECKDWGSKVGINTIRAFNSKVDDVNAKQGVIVSAKGFTSEAKKYADIHNIILYKLVDAESEKWNEAALIPIIVGRINLNTAEVEIIDNQTKNIISIMDGAGDVVGVDRLYLYESEKNRYIKLRSFLEERWDECSGQVIPDTFIRAFS